MKKIRICPIEQLDVPGVHVRLPGDVDVYEESYLRWHGTRLQLEMKNTLVAGGVLKVWRHQPVFQKLEYHDDREKYVFLQGNVIMPFADVKDGMIVESSLQYARIQAGTEILIEAGKAHFMPVADDTDCALAMVICTNMPYYHVFLKEPVCGV